MSGSDEFHIRLRAEGQCKLSSHSVFSGSGLWKPPLGLSEHVEWSSGRPLFHLKLNKKQTFAVVSHREFEFVCYLLKPR